MRHGARVFNTSQFPKLIMCPYNIIVLSIFHCCFSPVHLQEGRYLQSITKETLSVSRRMMALENKVDQVDEFGIVYEMRKRMVILYFVHFVMNWYKQLLINFETYLSVMKHIVPKHAIT